MKFKIWRSVSRQTSPDQFVSKSDTHLREGAVAGSNLNTEGHKLGQVCAERSAKSHTSSVIEQCAASTAAPSILRLSWFWRWHPTNAWLTLKSIGNTTVKPDELARSVLRWKASAIR